MTDPTRAYPELSPFLDHTDVFDVQVEELNIAGQDYLLVTQTGEFEGDQFLLKRVGDQLEFVQGDTVLGLSSFATLEDSLESALVGPASPADHAALDAHQRSRVNVFSSATGPDGGNLACVWAVRHLAHQALGRWITRTDGTAVFEPELRRAIGQDQPVANVAAGGLVISPTRTAPSGQRNIGHVGILGAGAGPTRPIYSNSSGRKRWEQNFTVQSWIDRYQTRKTLPVYFYPLPA